MVLNPESEWELLSAHDVDSPSESEEVNEAAITAVQQDEAEVENGEREALLLTPDSETNTTPQAADVETPPASAASVASVDDPPLPTITLATTAAEDAEGQNLTTGTNLVAGPPNASATDDSVENDADDDDDDTSNDEAIARALQDQEDQKGQQQDGVRKLKNIFGAVSRLVGDIDDKHKITRKTRNSVKTVGATLNTGVQKVSESARAVETVIDDKTKQIHEAYVQSNIERKAKNSVETVKGAVVTAGVTAKDTVISAGVVAKDNVILGGATVKEAAISAGATAKETATSVGQSALRFNEDYKVTEKLATAAVIGSAVLLAKGNIRTGAAVLAAGGAAYMANEATMNNTAPYRQTYDSGLGNEHMHMD